MMEDKIPQQNMEWKNTLLLINLEFKILSISLLNALKNNFWYYPSMKELESIFP